MTNNPLQDFLSQIRIPFLGDNLMRKYENEKSPLRAELFSIEQLESYAATLAAMHSISLEPSTRQLIRRLDENEAILKEVRDLLIESAQQNSPVAPAGEWLLDNFYIIEEQIQTGKKHFPKAYSETLPRLAKGPLAGLPRVYSIAIEIIAHSDGRIDPENLFAFVNAYQKVTNLNIGELWAIPIMLRLALIENLRRLAGTIARDRINKNLADYWADRMTETAEKDPKSLIIVTADMARSNPPMAGSFVAELTRRLLGKGPALSLPLTWVEQRLSENGLNTNTLVHKENQNQAADQVSMSNSISSLRFINNSDWRDFVEKTSLVDKILRDDIDNVYARMDFYTRDRYRHIVEDLAKRSKRSELEIASIASTLAREKANASDADPRNTHVGFYLIGKGVEQTEKIAGIKLSRKERLSKAICGIPFFNYSASIVILTLVLASLMIFRAYREELPTGWLILLGLISMIAVSHLATAVVNWVATILIPPAFLPRMDFSKKIPEETRTLVAVPTLFNNTSELDDLIETMEVRFLANRQKNLHFALLTDFRDAESEILPEDELLLAYASQKISALNMKYRDGIDDVFFLLHRPRKWNPAEKKWMGYERKRGKLHELNELIRGGSGDKFQLIAGDTQVLRKVRYVLTLDADTQLPREAAWKIIGSISHPLNHAYYNEKKKRVTQGYGILQPRLATNLSQTSASWYAKINANEPGIDPYTRAVSDVYQDVLSEGSFIGKGIYDVDAFQRSMNNRFPENRILSHDLLEGCHARSGLISDVQLYEEYPSSYLVDMKRRHRWIRGDWQIARWIFPRVPGPGKETFKNPLSALSRWKIFDNLRRSVVSPALFLLFLYGWIVSSSPWFWTFTVIGIIIPPTILSFLWNLYKKPPDVMMSQHVNATIETFVSHLIQNVWTILSLPYEVFVNLDAILRTAWRMFISRRHLLQWNPSHTASASEDLWDHYQKMWIAPLTGFGLFLLLSSISWPAFIIASPILILWIFSPLIAWWISIPLAPKKISLSFQQNLYLKNLARKTWAFFENFIGPDDNWLPPDNYQENPMPRIAHRTSPTNIGISLLSTLAAHDFGYLTTSQLISRCHHTINTMQSLERYKGHLYNWYDTQSLIPLYPRYVSTVDSGNLAACMLVLKEGLIDTLSKPIVSTQLYNGIMDTVRILVDKSKNDGPVLKMQEAAHSSYFPDTITASSALDFLKQMSEAAEQIRQQFQEDPESETAWWSNALASQCSVAYNELISLTSWMDKEKLPPKFIALTGLLDKIPSLLEIANLSSEVSQRIGPLNKLSLSTEESLWLETFLSHVKDAQQLAREMVENVERISKLCIELSDYEYDFLFDNVQHYFSIGYNVEEHRADAGFYDLLGSEARLGIYVAIAQGKIPQDSWFALGRQLTNSGTDPVLISWSGSMFEYLMPMLMVPSYEASLLNQSHKGAVKRQIEYGKRRGLPWGISESCFYMTHANMDYQYRAFGVPGLGLKRGLSDDYVVAPYATMMALMIDPDESYENLKALAAEGAEGKWGFYEAIDYTTARLNRGQTAGVVKSFMTHHQGMGFLSLAYLLLDQPMQKRFTSELQFQTSLLLLQEKIPQLSTFYTPAIDLKEAPPEIPSPELRVINTPNTPIPEVQLLSNGRYHVMVSNSGGGYSRWRDLAITRWREDGTCDNWGTFCYIRDLETNEFWSTAHQPTLKTAEHFEAIFSQGRAEFRRKQNNIDSYTEIIVSPEDDIEIRRLHLTNRTRKKRQIEITSYSEVVLNAPIAEMLHPAFSNLFVQTEILSQRHAIIATRRPRSVDERPPWMFHLMKVHQSAQHEVSYETSRDHFIGRGNSTADPQVMYQSEGLSGSEGSVLDPVMSIQYRIPMKPYESVIIDMVYGIERTRELCQLLAEKYQDKHMIDRAFELAWTHSNVVLRQINASAADALLYNRLAGSIIYANASLRADPVIILNNHRGQSGLWSHSISGDWPIVLLQVEDSSHLDLVEKLVQAHSFWRLKGLVVDLVIWNEDHGGYRQVLQNQILSLIAPANAADEQDRPGGIFIRSADQLSNEDRILFQTVARVIISDKLGTLEGQLNRRRKLKPIIPNFIPSKNYPLIESSIEIPEQLEFFNGLGGFSEDGREYVIITSPGKATPAPWSNVIANPHFGTVISESGQSYTWFQNAHELRLTPWNNDPVTDLGGEHFYMRDEESGRFWSPTPLPARGKSPYVTRHGFGYSVFEHVEDGIHTEMWVYVDEEKPIKYTLIKVRNLSGRVRQLTATGYVEWLLGDLRHKTMMHITTELDLNTGAIIARNSYTTEFGHLVAFFDVSDPSRTITTDREEFIGRNSTARNPDAMSKSKLSGKTGASLDPCGVIQVSFSLEDGEESEAIFRLGTGMHLNDLSYLLRESRGSSASREALAKVINYWESSLSVIKLNSPDVPLNLITNGWLNYQTLACRLWARSGYYQSGGAFGFRDQLQDVLSILHNEPILARNQIILCASRQFLQGDVQHWWHPPVGRGVRTRCSDDYLWLPFVTSQYILVTGDTTILDEEIQFLDSRELAAHEDSYYDLPIRSDQFATLYQHCVKAIEYGLQFGEHGLPLIGSGDWNDGMDRVGTEGKGESVWLAWFLYLTIEKFREIAELRNDERLTGRCTAMMGTLKQNIEQHAWDGEWYRRAYFDDGTPLGSKENQECKIDSIAQSWSIISGAGEKERATKGMYEAETRLVRKQDKIIQLFDPPFNKSDLNPGYIKGYVPGVRENGGQYTHAAIWMIMAFAIMRDKVKMWELLQMINPVNHGKTPEGMSVYKVEPYVVAADVYAVSQHSGRGGWTWYTGSAGWMYQLIIEYVIGINRRANTIEFRPCLPVEWKTVNVQYRYHKTNYSIEIIQHSPEGETIKITLDRGLLKFNSLPLVDDGQEHEVVVEIM